LTPPATFDKLLYIARIGGSDAQRAKIVTWRHLREFYATDNSQPVILSEKGKR